MTPDSDDWTPHESPTGKSTNVLVEDSRFNNMRRACYHDDHSKRVTNDSLAQYYLKCYPKLNRKRTGTVSISPWKCIFEPVRMSFFCLVLALHLISPALILIFEWEVIAQTWGSRTEDGIHSLYVFSANVLRPSSFIWGDKAHVGLSWWLARFPNLELIPPSWQDDTNNGWIRD